MEIMASDVTFQTMGHVARPACGRGTVTALPHICFRLQAALTGLRHARTSQKLSKQVRCLGQRVVRRFIGRLSHCSEDPTAHTERHGWGCPG